MFWKHSRKDTALLLNATLLLASAYALFFTHAWKSEVQTHSDADTMLANTVGVFAGVEENEVNGILAQLDARERELDAREEMIARTTYSNEQYPLRMITLVGIGLFGLILMNFYLDSKRRISLAG